MATTRHLNPLLQLYPSLRLYIVALPVVLACLWLAACSVAPTRQADQQQAVLSSLYTQYHEWQGTPYRLGGLSKQGIDCSGLVYLTFRDRFGIPLPRNTDDLARAGEKIKPKDRITGDLVLFRINRKVKHVGIYLENDRFMHASTSRGVMISNLQDPYWRSRYWQTVRIPGLGG